MGHRTSSRQVEIRFTLGRVVATPGALDALSRSGEDGREMLDRHSRADWGCVCSEDANLNDAAISQEDHPAFRYRVLSSYRTRLNETVWVITEADRSATTILLPSEY